MYPTEMDVTLAIFEHARGAFAHFPNFIARVSDYDPRIYIINSCNRIIRGCPKIVVRRKVRGTIYNMIYDVLGVRFT
jgi:hypothetical protein